MKAIFFATVMFFFFFSTQAQTGTTPAYWPEDPEEQKNILNPDTANIDIYIIYYNIARIDSEGNEIIDFPSAWTTVYWAAKEMLLTFQENTPETNYKLVYKLEKQEKKE